MGCVADIFHAFLFFAILYSIVKDKEQRRQVNQLRNSFLFYLFQITSTVKIHKKYNNNRQTEGEVFIMSPSTTAKNRRITPTKATKKVVTGTATRKGSAKPPCSPSHQQSLTTKLPSRKKANGKDSTKKPHTSKPKRADRVHFPATIHLKVLQKEVEKERKRRREMKLPKEAINLPVSIRQTFYRLSDKNEMIKSGKWLSDLCARSKRSNNSTTHELLSVLDQMGVDVGRAKYCREQNKKISEDKEVRCMRQYDKWFMDNFVKLNMWIGTGKEQRSIDDIETSCNDDGLKKFVLKIKQAYDKGDMDQKYIHMLDAISFPWRPFNENFQLLCSYYMENGDMDIDESDQPQLFRFVTSMRKCKAKGKLSEIEMTMLSNIGFPWENSEERPNKKAKGSLVISVTTPTGVRTPISERTSTFLYSGGSLSMNDVSCSSKTTTNNDNRFGGAESDNEERSNVDKLNGFKLDDSLSIEGEDEDGKSATGSFVSNYDKKEEDESTGDKAPLADVVGISSSSSSSLLSSSSSSSSSSEGDKEGDLLDVDDKTVSELESNAGGEDKEDNNVEVLGDKKKEGPRKLSFTSSDLENKEVEKKETSDKANEEDDLQDNGRLFMLQWNSKSGFQSRVCSFCSKVETRHHCCKPSKNGHMFFNDTVICGKSFCHECKLKVGLESSNTCLDCHRAAEEEKKKAMTTKTTKTAKTTKKYSLESLNEMNVEELRAICQEEKIEYGSKRKPGCLKILKSHFNLLKK